MIIIGQVSSIDKVESAFEVVNKYNLEEDKNYALYPEDSILAITSKDRHSLAEASYGLIPFWMQNPKKYYDAPVEGKAISDEYANLKKGIIHEPTFRKSIRELRAVVPVDYFILHEGDKSILFFDETKALVLAGLIDYWKPSIVEKNLYKGLALLTLPAKGIYKECGFTRQPMIIDEKNRKNWLMEISLTEVTNMIGYTSDKTLNGYPVDNNLFVAQQKNKEITQPIDKYIKPNAKLNTRERVKNKFRKTSKPDNNEQEYQIWRQPF